MKIQFNKGLNRTYILGTTEEIAETIAKEAARRIKKDASYFNFPNFDFTIVEESDIDENLCHTAERSGGWYGCRDISTEFNDKYDRTLLADYYGGGSASVASYGIDCDDEFIRDIVINIVSDTLTKDTSYDPSFILIAEVAGKIEDNSTEAARIAKLMEGQNKIMTFDDGTYLNIRFNEDARKLEAGIVTNAGLYVTYSVDYDFDENLYDNLSKLYHIVSERKNKKN